MAGSSDVLILRQELMKGLRSEFSRQEVRDRTSMELSRETLKYLKQLNGPALGPKSSNGGGLNVLSKLTDDFEDYSALDEKYSEKTEKWQKKSLEVWEDILEELKHCKCGEGSGSGGSGGSLKGLLEIGALAVAIDAVETAAADYKSFVKGAAEVFETAEASVETAASKIKAAGNDLLSSITSVTGNISNAGSSLLNGIQKLFPGTSVAPTPNGKGVWGQNTSASPATSAGQTTATSPSIVGKGLWGSNATVNVSPSNSPSFGSNMSTIGGAGLSAFGGGSSDWEVPAAAAGLLGLSLVPGVDLAVPALAAGAGALLMSGKTSTPGLGQTAYSGSNLPISNAAYTSSSPTVDTLYVNTLVASNGRAGTTSFLPTSGGSMISLASDVTSGSPSSSDFLTSVLGNLFGGLGGTDGLSGIANEITSALSLYNSGINADSNGNPITGHTLSNNSTSIESTFTPGAGTGKWAALDKKYGLPQGFLEGVEAKESKGNTGAMSSKGALGAFQFMPGTWAQYGSGSPRNETDSANAAGRYFAHLSKEFGGNTAEMLAAYNAGPGRVASSLKSGSNWLSTLPAETQDYVSTIDANSAVASSSPSKTYARSKATPSGTTYAQSNPPAAATKLPLSTANTAPTLGLGVTNSTPSLDELPMTAQDIAVLLANSTTS